MLGSHVDILSGFAFDSNKFNDRGVGVPIVRIRNVGKSKSDTFYDGVYSNDYILNNGDLLIGMDGDFRLAKWNGGMALLNQRVCKIKCASSELLEEYLYYMLPKQLKKIEDTTSFATVKHLSVKKIKEIKI
ncbi:MAG: restriction endonuclease subunit S, partial [Bacteroidia bacterium]